MNRKLRVLILCTGNSARSQMAEGLLRHDAGERFDVESAGTNPGGVRSEAIAAMREIGIDISGHRSKHVAEFEHAAFDYVITVCDHARETCPVFSAPPPRSTTILRTPPRRPARKKSAWPLSAACAMSCAPTWTPLRALSQPRADASSRLRHRGGRRGVCEFAGFPGLPQSRIDLAQILARIHHPTGRRVYFRSQDAIPR